MSIATFIKNFEESVGGIPPGSITPETDFQKLDQWDSLAFLCLLEMIDAEYAVEVPGVKVRDCRTIQELFDAVCAAK